MCNDNSLLHTRAASVKLTAAHTCGRIRAQTACSGCSNRDAVAASTGRAGGAGAETGTAGTTGSATTRTRRAKAHTDVSARIARERTPPGVQVKSDQPGEPSVRRTPKPLSTRDHSVNPDPPPLYRLSSRQRSHSSVSN